MKKYKYLLDYYFTCEGLIEIEAESKEEAEEIASQYSEQDLCIEGDVKFGEYDVYCIEEEEEA